MIFAIYKKELITANRAGNRAAIRLIMSNKIPGPVSLSGQRTPVLTAAVVDKRWQKG